LRKSDQPGNISQRGSVENDTEPRFLVIGQVSKPHGVRGDLRVVPYTDVPERFTWLDEVYVGEVDPQPIGVEYARLHKNWILLKLKGYDNRDRVEALRGALLQVKEDEAIPLEEDEYFLYQLIGLRVIEVGGKELGILQQVIETGANNVFVVAGARGEILIPDTAEVVQDIDFDKGVMFIQLLPGLLST
jgi:16S rRNA processing protein RimM